MKFDKVLIKLPSYVPGKPKRKKEDYNDNEPPCVYI
jgi:hypothetical protein